MPIKSLESIIVTCLVLGFVLSQACDAQQIQVATYNINYGNRQLEQVVQVIEQSSADFVMLQETTERSEAFLRAKLSAKYPHFHACGHNGTYFAERFVCASKEPLTDVRFIAPRYGLFGCYLAEAKVAGKTIQLVNVHLAPIQISAGRGLAAALTSFSQLEKTHQAELEYIIEHLDFNKPIVMAGDFNSISKSPEQKHLRKLGLIDAHESLHSNADSDHTWQWPTGSLPLILRIDYVLHSSHFKALDSQVLRKPGSDHYLLHSTLELK